MSYKFGVVYHAYLRIHFFDQTSLISINSPGPGFQGLLHQWRPGMSVIFVSHQWLGTGHPDPEGRHAATLRASLQGILDGTLANKKGNVSTRPNRLLDDLGSLS